MKLIDKITTLRTQIQELDEKRETLLLEIEKLGEQASQDDRILMTYVTKVLCIPCEGQGYKDGDPCSVCDRVGSHVELSYRNIADLSRNERAPIIAAFKRVHGG